MIVFVNSMTPPLDFVRTCGLRTIQLGLLGPAGCLGNIYIYIYIYIYICYIYIYGRVRLYGGMKHPRKLRMKQYCFIPVSYPVSYPCFIPCFVLTEKCVRFIALFHTPVGSPAMCVIAGLGVHVTSSFFFSSGLLTAVVVFSSLLQQNGLLRWSAACRAS